MGIRFTFWSRYIYITMGDTDMEQKTHEYLNFLDDAVGSFTIN